MPGTDPLWQALMEVTDPEHPISLVDMGLIYGISRQAGCVRVAMTFTATACPCMEWMIDDVRSRLLQEPGVEQVAVDVVWDPPWTVDRLSPRAGELLRRWGVSV